MKRVQDKPVSVPFHHLSSLVQSTTSTAINVNPTGLSTRMLAIADNYCAFRLRALKFRLLPNTNVTNNINVGYVGGVQDTPPTTEAQIMELENAVTLAVGTSSAASVPTEWVKVPLNELAGVFPWYKTVPGAADVTEELPGQIIVRCNGTSQLANLEIRGVMEFKDPLDAGNTPVLSDLKLKIRAEVSRIAADKKRDELLKTLSLTGSTVKI